MKYRRSVRFTKSRNPIYRTKSPKGYTNYKDLSVKPGQGKMSTTEKVTQSLNRKMRQKPKNADEIKKKNANIRRGHATREDVKLRSQDRRIMANEELTKRVTQRQMTKRAKLEGRYNPKAEIVRASGTAAAQAGMGASQVVVAGQADKLVNSSQDIITGGRENDVTTEDNTNDNESTVTDEGSQWYNPRNRR